MKFFNIRHFQDYFPRTKIIASSLLVGVTSIEVVAYVGFNWASQIVTIVSGKLEESIQSLNETERTNIVKSEVVKADEVSLTTQNSVFQVADYRATLYDQTSILRRGSYWDAKHNLIHMDDSQYHTLPTGLFNSFNNNAIDLNVNAFLDFIAPDIIEGNPNIGTAYYDNAEGVIHYYFKTDFSEMPPDFDSRRGALEGSSLFLTLPIDAGVVENWKRNG